MTWLKDKMRRLWAWLRADWKRWLVLPAVLGGLVALGRLARGKWAPSPADPGPAGTLTPEQGEAEIEKIDEAEAAGHAAEDERLEGELTDIEDAFR